MTDTSSRRPVFRSAVGDFIRVARETPKDVSIVFIVAAVLNILSYYIGSRRFFRGIFFSSLGADPHYMLYEYLYWFAAEFVCSFLLPLSAILILHRSRPAAFGLKTGDREFGFKIVGLFVAVMIPVCWVASDQPGFAAVYPHAQLVKGDWSLFLVYEAFFLLYFFGWEFIWRGYVLFGLEKHLGAGPAVLVQMLPFVILHNGKPVLETFGAIIGAIALGALALRTRSFLYCFATHWTVMFFMDLFSTLRERTQAHGLGFDALTRIVTGLFP